MENPTIDFKEIPTWFVERSLTIATKDRISIHYEIYKELQNKPPRMFYFQWCEILARKYNCSERLINKINYEL